MKLLIIGNWKNISGYSSQIVNHILALDSVGVNVVPRHINLINNNNPELPARVIELEQGSCKKNPDIVILNTLPSLYERQGSAKYVSYFVCETSNFRRSGWAAKLNLMDLVLVPNFFVKQACINSGVKTKIEIVPQSIDVNKFDKDVPIHAIRQNYPQDFIFYTIGEFTRRKNMEAIIKAFYLAFSPNAPVQLFIKTTPVGMNDPAAHINGIVDNIKNGLKLYNDNNRYKPIRIHCAFSSEEEMLSIHKSSDCFVTASRGEAFNIPCMDAMVAGKTIIGPNHSGQDYLTGKNSYLVNFIEEPMFGHVDTLNYLYSGYENGYEVKVNSLIEQMRNAFEKKDLNRRKAEQTSLVVQKYSYQNVGQIYKKVLEKLSYE